MTDIVRKRLHAQLDRTTLEHFIHEHFETIANLLEAASGKIRKVEADEGLTTIEKVEVVVRLISHLEGRANLDVLLRLTAQAERAQGKEELLQELFPEGETK